MKNFSATASEQKSQSLRYTDPEFQKNAKNRKTERPIVLLLQDGARPHSTGTGTEVSIRAGDSPTTPENGNCMIPDSRI